MMQVKCTYFILCFFLILHYYLHYFTERNNISKFFCAVVQIRHKQNVIKMPHATSKSGAYCCHVYDKNLQLLNC